jgi:hypothetical protein
MENQFEKFSVVYELLDKYLGDTIKQRCSEDEYKLRITSLTLGVEKIWDDIIGMVLCCQDDKELKEHIAFTLAHDVFGIEDKYMLPRCTGYAAQLDKSKQYGIVGKRIVTLN